MKFIRCPKCKSETLFLTEHGTWGTTFSQEDGVLTDIGHHEHGNIFKVTGYCRKCKHTWTLRNITQIDN